MIRRALACAVLSLAAGCATAPVGPVAGDQHAALQQLDDWSLKGRVAIAAGTEGFSGGIVWRQQGPHAGIELRGPLGGQALTIEVDGDRFVVADGEGARLEGAEAERLVRERIGAALPMTEMRYWLLGIPAPGLPFRETAAPDGSLQSLEQSAWQVQVLRRTTAGSYVLPARIEMSTTGLRLRLSVTDWQVSP